MMRNYEDTLGLFFNEPILADIPALRGAKAARAMALPTAKAFKPPRDGQGLHLPCPEAARVLALHERFFRKERAFVNGIGIYINEAGEQVCYLPYFIKVLIDEGYTLVSIDTDEVDGATREYELTFRVSRSKWVGAWL